MQCVDFGGGGRRVGQIRDAITRKVISPNPDDNFGGTTPST